jgi:hypothetical protein
MEALTYATTDGGQASDPLDRRRAAVASIALVATLAALWVAFA